MASVVQMAQRKIFRTRGLYTVRHDKHTHMQDLAQP